MWGVKGGKKIRVWGCYVEVFEIEGKGGGVGVGLKIERIGDGGKEMREVKEEVKEEGEEEEVR